MATLKSLRPPDEIEDIILQKIFLIKDAEIRSGKIFMVKDDEIVSDGKDMRLCRESMEIVLIIRLLGDFVEAEPPFTYLVKCFQRAYEEEKKIQAMKCKNVLSDIETIVKQAKNVIASHCRFHLSRYHDNASSPLLPLLLSQVDVCTAFIEELFKEAGYEIVKPILNQLFENLRDSVVRVSALGDFEEPLRAFLNLINIPVGAMVLVDHLNGLSGNLNGREIETMSVLGAFLHVSGLPDHHDFKSLPDVGLADVRDRIDSLRDYLADGLDSLLKMNKVVCENVVQFLAMLINKNASRAYIQVDPLSCASSGTFVNLSAIMLQLCEPLLDDPTKRSEIDPTYVFSSRLEFRGLTSIHATSDQVSEWSRSGNINQQEFPFICECFFMTARVLNLGLMKTISHISHLNETVKTCENDLYSLKARGSLSPQQQQEITRLEKEIISYLQEKKCYEAQILKDGWLIKDALSFYRIMLAWMVDLAGGFKIPAPETCPVNFAAMPEHFVDDAMELLICTRRFESFDQTELADFMNFIIMFMDTPEFVQNPYLRTKMVDVLYYWIPNNFGNEFLQGHQPTLDYLVRNLLHLFANTDLNTRYYIAKILKYLWGIPVHRKAWKRIAKEEENGMYLQFLNNLMNDIIYILDEEVMNKIMNQEQLDSGEKDEIKNCMIFANVYIDMICFTTGEIIVASFFLPEMVERVASMLNYFLAQIVKMLQHKTPALNDLAKYGFQPERLLVKIVKIYVNLSIRDRENVFAPAITKDRRSYYVQLFGAAARELKKDGEEDAKMINDILKLGRKAKVAAKVTEEAELAMGEIPEEFMDPIMGTLMSDPVILPVTDVRIDRPVILRHLLCKSMDPFSRLPLTADMLIPDTKLKAKIDSFLQRHDLRHHVL